VPDRRGDLPPDRRTWHLSSLMTFRHGLLRGLDERRQRQRFRTVLAMPALDAADMCSECEAPRAGTPGMSRCACIAGGPSQDLRPKR
jgi:hypothetical protein